MSSTESTESGTKSTFNFICRSVDCNTENKVPFSKLNKIGGITCVKCDKVGLFVNKCYKTLADNTQCDRHYFQYPTSKTNRTGTCNLCRPKLFNQV